MSWENCEGSCVTPKYWFGVVLVHFIRCVNAYLKKDLLPLGNTSQSLCPSLEEMRAVHSSVGLVSAFCASLPVIFFHHFSYSAVAISELSWSAGQRCLYRLGMDLTWVLCLRCTLSSWWGFGTGSGMISFTKAKIIWSQIQTFVRVSIRTTRTDVLVWLEGFLQISAGPLYLVAIRGSSSQESDPFLKQFVL